MLNSLCVVMGILHKKLYPFILFKVPHVYKTLNKHVKKNIRVHRLIEIKHAYS